MKGYMGVSQQERVKAQTCLHIDRYTKPGTQSRLSIHLSDIFIKKQELRGLLFKFVDFLYSRSELFDRVIKVISSENIFFSLSFDV